jgi:iron complex transport system permease protein
MTEISHARRQGFMALATPAILSFVTVIAMLLSVCIGVYPVSFARVGEIIASLAWPFPLPDHVAWTLKEQIVVQVVRLPRVVVATMAGLGLGMSGAALQGMMRNPLVSPDLVGVTSGAAFGGVLGMLFDLSSIGVVGCALAGGVLALDDAAYHVRSARGRAANVWHSKDRRVAARSARNPGCCQKRERG